MINVMLVDDQNLVRKGSQERKFGNYIECYE